MSKFLYFYKCRNDTCSYFSTGLAVTEKIEKCPCCENDSLELVDTEPVCEYCGRQTVDNVGDRCPDCVTPIPDYRF